MNQPRLVPEIAQLARVLLPGGKGYLAMLAAYLDASGVTASEDHLVMAGFVGREDQWTEFESEWKALLAEPRFASRLPEKNGRKYAHAKVMRQWPKDLRQSFYVYANDLLKRYTLFGIGGAVSHADYQKAYKGYPLTQKDSIYGFSFRACMVMACKNINENHKNLPCAFLLERGDPNQGGARVIFEGTAREAKMLDEIRRQYNVSTFGLGFKEDFGAFQAADMHAYGLKEHLEKTNGKGQLTSKTVYQSVDLGLLLIGQKAVHHRWTHRDICVQREINILKHKRKKEYGRRKTTSSSERS